MLAVQQLSIGNISFSQSVTWALQVAPVVNNKTKKILSYVPSAIFPAIIFPPIFLDSAGSLDFESNPKILAAVFAIIIGFFSRSIIATIFAGLISYWFLIFVYYQ